MVVWSCPIQFGVELTLMECLSNLCMSKQKHPCTPLVICLIHVPSMIVNLNLSSPFEVLLESPYLNLLIVVFCECFAYYLQLLNLDLGWNFINLNIPWFDVYNRFQDIFYPLNQLLFHIYL